MKIYAFCFWFCHETFFACNFFPTYSILLNFLKLCLSPEKLLEACLSSGFVPKFHEPPRKSYLGRTRQWTGLHRKRLFNEIKSFLESLGCSLLGLSWHSSRASLSLLTSKSDYLRPIFSVLVTPTYVYADRNWSHLCPWFQLLLILTAVQLVGAIASFTNVPELWAAYSVTQGIQVGSYHTLLHPLFGLLNKYTWSTQGLLIAMLVSCNCRILRMYAQPRGTKKRKENYTSLRDGEGGRFGILSVTNPNYENFTAVQSPMTDNDQSLVKMNYKEDDFVERSENILQHQPANDKIFGDLSSALNIKEIVNGPTPMTV